MGLIGIDRVETEEKNDQRVSEIGEAPLSIERMEEIVVAVRALNEGINCDLTAVMATMRDSDTVGDWLELAHFVGRDAERLDGRTRENRLALIAANRKLFPEGMDEFAREIRANRNWLVGRAVNGDLAQIKAGNLKERLAEVLGLTKAQESTVEVEA